MNELLLPGKVAIVYGGGGSLGAAVARTFAREGAAVFLAGRTRATLEAAAEAVRAAGGRAEVDVLDATDEAAVDAHAASVVERAGALDVSLNLTTRGDRQGTPLITMELDAFLGAITTGLTTAFLTARAAARQMATQPGGGAILHLTSGSSRGAAPGLGNTGPADAATEAFLRSLAAENGQHGVRVVGIHTAGVRGTLTREKIEAVSGAPAPEPEQLYAALGAMTMLRRVPELEQIAETATFLASDRAGAITSGIVNATSGLIAG